MISIYSFIAGIITICICALFFKDWASGVMGFIYGGILLFAISLIIKILNLL